MNARSLQAFIRYKKLPKGTKLTYQNDGDPVFDSGTGQMQDSNGNALPLKQMQATGAWKANKPLKQFGSAISRVHKAHTETGFYFDLCSKCYEHDKACDRHTDFKRTFRRGDPTLDQGYLDEKDGLMDKRYRERGASRMRPKDVRKIRDYLLTGNNIVFLGVYVMILIAIRIFLRADEVITIRLADFYTDLTLRTLDEKIHGLCIRVFGKQMRHGSTSGYGWTMNVQSYVL